MRYLMDTHVFLWWCMNDSRLSAAAIEVIANADNDILFSVASGWEIALKAAQGKLALPETPMDFVTSRCQQHKFQTLPVRLDHALRVAELPEHHHDPFDRLLVAQCQLDGLPLITANPDIKKYDLEIAW
jgi:PIN domain nuclease of toxin-antitoxin system